MIVLSIFELCQMKSGMLSGGGGRGLAMAGLQDFRGT